MAVVNHKYHMRKWIKLVENEVIDDDADTAYDDQQEAEYARVRKMEKSIETMCSKEFGWEFDGVSYPVIYDATENEIHITVADTEVTLQQLQKLTCLGDRISITPVNGHYSLSISIKAHQALNIT